MADEREPLNIKRKRLQREKALREAIDKICECQSMWNTDDRYKHRREEAVQLILQCLT